MVTTIRPGYMFLILSSLSNDSASECSQLCRGQNYSYKVYSGGSLHLVIFGGFRTHLKYDDQAQRNPLPINISVQLQEKFPEAPKKIISEIIFELLRS